MENNKDNIDEILDEVHNSEEIDKCRHNKILIYENEFILTKLEAYDGLKNSGMIKTVGMRSIIYTILLLLAIVGFIFAYTIQPDINNIVFAVISVIILMIVWIVPSVSLGRLAKANANGNLIHFKVYIDSLHILCNNSSWYVALDNSNKMNISKNVIIIRRIKDNQLFVLPIRAIDEVKREAVIDLLKKGTLNF